MKSNKKEEKIIKEIEGIISISGKGTGYLKMEGKKEDIEIDYKHLNTALHGDKVRVTILSKIKDRTTGAVTEILERVKMGFSGVLEKEDEVFFLKPDDNKMYTDILIPEKMLNGAKLNDKVYAKITSWKDHNKAPIGEVVKVLGRPGDHNTEMHSIVIEKGFDLSLPDLVEQDAERIKIKGINEEDYKNRKDFRNTLTFTIDPFDAKDFDDAISFKELGKDKYEIGIHIADVSYYVRPGTSLDDEAKSRGTSVYLVDRTIPMLPEVLSNDLCSLVPHQDRLVMSAVFTMNKNAEVLDEWYGHSVINSQKRFTYEEAYESIKDKTKPLHKELTIINSIAHKLTKDRFANGAVSLDQEEVKFVLDENGKPIKVVKKERTDSNKLIEELMLLANRKVAEKMYKATKEKGAFIYRIHDLPNKEKSFDLALFLKGLGYTVKMQNGTIPSYEINRILSSIKNKDEKNTIHKAVIRSMAKAIYSTKNIGHYGLAFKYYTHFTSPIRRYPDVIVHRLLSMHLNGEKINTEDRMEYEKISRISSEQEKRASEAERASVKYKQVEFMSTRVGETMTGVISGISEWGIYVEEIETKCEGMVRMRDLNDDFYVLNEKKMELVGKKKGKKFRFGDRIKIQVKKVDLEKKTIDYMII